MQTSELAKRFVALVVTVSLYTHVSHTLLFPVYVNVTALVFISLATASLYRRIDVTSLFTSACFLIVSFITVGINAVAAGYAP